MTGDGHSVLAAIISDAGSVLEVVALERGRFLMLHHQIGQISLLGIYDAPPSDEQIADILSGADREGGRTRATVRLRANGNTEIEMEAPAAAARRTFPSPEGEGRERVFGGGVGLSAPLAPSPQLSPRWGEGL